MAAYNKFNSFVEAVEEKVHNFATDQLQVALTASANAPVATNTKLADLTEISYAFCSSRVLTTVSSAQVAGLYKLMIANLTLIANGGTVGPFRYVVIYNNSATNKELIAWADYGQDRSILAGETFAINFDQANGLFSVQ